MASVKFFGRSSVATGSGGGEGGGSGGTSLTGLVSIGASATGIVDTTLTATNVTLTGASPTIEFTWPSDRDAVTYVRVLQSSGGGFVPTFAGVTWLTPQPPWATQSGLNVEDIRVYEINSGKFAEWMGYAASLGRSTWEQTFPAGKFVTADYETRTSAVPADKSMRMFRWHNWDAPTLFTSWAFEISLAATTTQPLTVRAGIYLPSVADPYIPGSLLIEFPLYTVAAGLLPIGVLTTAIPSPVAIPRGSDFFVAALVQCTGLSTLELRHMSPSVQHPVANTMASVFGAAHQNVFRQNTIAAALPAVFDPTVVTPSTLNPNPSVGLAIGLGVAA